MAQSSQWYGVLGDMREGVLWWYGALHEMELLVKLNSC